MFILYYVLLFILGVVIAACFTKNKSKNEENEKRQKLIDLSKKLEDEVEAAVKRSNDNLEYCNTIVEKYKDFSRMYIPVAGLFYRRNSAKERLAKCSTRSVVKLKREPSNPYDSNAVQIYIDGVKAGYVPQKKSLEVTELILQNKIVHVNVSDIVYDHHDDVDSIDIIIFHKE